MLDKGSPGSTHKVGWKMASTFENEQLHILITILVREVNLI